MFRRYVLLLTLLALGGLVAPAMAQQSASVTFTLTLKSAFLRAAPERTAAKVASVFQGQTYPVRARSADGQWVQLAYPGPASETWILQAYGTVQGDLTTLPLGSAPTSKPAPSATAVPASYYAPTDWPIIPTVSQTARDLYQRGLALGNRPQAFAKVGDCQSVTPYFLAAFDTGNYRLGPYADLQPTIDYFAGSFARKSAAVSIGFSPANIFVAVWADPKRCRKNESPLACELRLQRPSFVFISLGTNGAWLSDGDYETYLRQSVETVIARGAVPILATKPDDTDGGGRFNRIIVKLAQEYDLPLWNFWRAVQPLPNHGLNADGVHLSWARDYFDDPTLLQAGYPMRNLTALQVLQAVWQGVK